MSTTRTAGSESVLISTTVIPIHPLWSVKRWETTWTIWCTFSTGTAVLFIFLRDEAGFFSNPAKTPITFPLISKTGLPQFPGGTWISKRRGPFVRFVFHRCHHLQQRNSCFFIAMHETRSDTSPARQDNRNTVAVLNNPLMCHNKSIWMIDESGTNTAPVLTLTGSEHMNADYGTLRLTNGVNQFSAIF